jgi:hypothetical protein
MMFGNTSKQQKVIMKLKIHVSREQDLLQK